MENSARIRINLSSKEVEVEGSEQFVKEYAEKIESLLSALNGPKSLTPTISIDTGDNTSSAKSRPTGIPETLRVSVREFLDEHNAKRNPDIITAVALYMSIYDNKPYFTREDILNAFETAAEAVPKNFPRDLKWAIKIGWIAEKRGTKDTYYVTSSGKSAVNTSFPNELLKKTKDPFSGKKASAKKIQENEA